jgi:anti-sigma B factor antagonist
MELEIAIDRSDEGCVLTLSGEVDLYTAPNLKQAIVDSVDDGCTSLVIDLEQVSFIDSSGLGVLISGLRRVKEHGGTLRLVCTKDGILKIFRITGLDKVFPVFATADEAREL